MVWNDNLGVQIAITTEISKTTEPQTFGKIICSVALNCLKCTKRNRRGYGKANHYEKERC